MRRATVTISDDIEASLDLYIGQQEVSPALTSIVQAARREFLGRRGFMARPKRLRITPAKQGGGASDVSFEDDRYVAVNGFRITSG